MIRPFTAQRRALMTGTAMMLVGLAMASPASADPTGGTVVAGTAAIDAAPALTTITQTSPRAIINWTDFDVGADQAVAFRQPDASAVTLNRVNSADASRIDGSITANGRIFIVNPNGVLFGGGARLQVGGLVATTADIRDASFMAGIDAFDRPSTNTEARVENAGLISIADTGIAALVAPTVVNRGTITASLGAVTLGGHATFTLDLAGDGLLAFDTGQRAAVAGKVSHDGAIIADGGRVTLDAAAAEGVVDGVIDMTGLVQARSVGSREGRIVLSGATVAVAGTIDASASTDGANGGTVLIGGNRGGIGPERNALSTTIAPAAKISADGLGTGDGGEVIVWADGRTDFEGAITARGGTSGGKGGFVETSGRETLSIASGNVNASGPGGAGTWLLDPTDIIISSDPTSNGSLGGGNFGITPGSNAATVNAGEIVASLNGGTSVRIATASDGTANGDISVLSPIAVTGTGSVALTLQASRNLTIDQPITGRRLTLNLYAPAGTMTLNAALETQDNIAIEGGSFIQTANGRITAGDFFRGDLSISANSMNFGGTAGSISNVDLLTLRPFSADVTIAPGAGPGLRLDPALLRTVFDNVRSLSIGSLGSALSVTGVTRLFTATTLLGSTITFGPTARVSFDVPEPQSASSPLGGRSRFDSDRAGCGRDDRRAHGRTDARDRFTRLARTGWLGHRRERHVRDDGPQQDLGAGRRRGRSRDHTGFSGQVRRCHPLRLQCSSADRDGHRYRCTQWCPRNAVGNAKRVDPGWEFFAKRGRLLEPSRRR